MCAFHFAILISISLSKSSEVEGTLSGICRSCSEIISRRSKLQRIYISRFLSSHLASGVSGVLGTPALFPCIFTSLPSCSRKQTPCQLPSLSFRCVLLRLQVLWDSRWNTNVVASRLACYTNLYAGVSFRPIPYYCFLSEF